MRATVTALMVLAAVALSGTALRAHHSYVDFVHDHDTTITGVIDAIQFQNPHVLIHLHTANATRYTAEWRSAEWLRAHAELVNAGAGPLRSDTLRPGDRIVITGWPARDPSLHRVVELKEVRRPADGWVWKTK